MTRRTLVDGLNETPKVDEQEKQFVFGDKAGESSPEPAEEPKVMPQFKARRVPLTTRCSPELASKLKRASLERQLNGQEPCQMQDIIEVALEDWLENNGY